jgi:hypothetical protein
VNGLRTAWRHGENGIAPSIWQSYSCRIAAEEVEFRGGQPQGTAQVRAVLQKNDTFLFYSPKSLYIGR